MSPLFVTVWAVIALASCANAFFVTISKQNYVDVYNCISDAKNQDFCDKLLMCNLHAPEKVIKATVECQGKYIPDTSFECSEKHPLLPNKDAAGQVVDCIHGIVGENPTDEEKEKETLLENCYKELSKTANCNIVFK